MKKTILVMAVFAMLASCKKKSDEGITPPDRKEQLSPDIKLVVTGATEESKPLYKRPETYNFLGFGYDVTDKFDDEASVRASVVDVLAYAASGSDLVSISRGTEIAWRTIEAQNAAHLSQQFSWTYKETKDLRLFGNTIEKIFPGTVATDKKYVYGYYSNYMVWKRYEFYPEQTVNKFLTTGFRNDITLLSAEALIHKYGTHVLAGIKMGSKFDVIYQAEAPAGNRGYVVMEGLRYAIKRTFGLMTGAMDDVNLENLNANSKAQIYYSSIGGDVSKLKTETINNRLMLNITDWRSTNTEENARFIGVFRDRLVPLNTFIDEPLKKAEVKSYIEKYLAAKAVKLTN
ncbi:MAC/perforin domain-containing protein [Pedobacter sp. KBW06]|uniref:MAC/perforin domain-containing protein n=1 Tax=Pedobacter sp. KBW06 TaxID=2153359 RepID=UPI0013150414|nr:MAC/perforin domain-containing protein [Pedobacter sp. KBW06]